MRLSPPRGGGEGETAWFILRVEQGVPVESLAGRTLRALPLRSPPASDLGASRFKLSDRQRAGPECAPGSASPISG